MSLLHRPNEPVRHGPWRVNVLTRSPWSTSRYRLGRGRSIRWSQVAGTRRRPGHLRAVPGRLLGRPTIELQADDRYDG